MTIDAQFPELQAALALIEAFLEAERESRKIPGISLAVVHDQELVWAKGLGYANLAHGVPATAQTIYRVASITKLFTATMLMQLRDAGKLHLDEPLERYAPAVKIPVPFSDSSPVTFRQVAAHMAGIARDSTAPVERNAKTVIMASAAEILANLKDVEFVSPPMVQKHYSNLGFSLLGFTLEQIAGQEYTRYITEHILHPLGMMSSGFEPAEAWPAELQARLATPYHAVQEDEIVPPEAPEAVERGLNPAGGLYSSVEDIARFLALQFRDGPAQGAQILKGSTLREMHAPVFLDPGWQEGMAIAWHMRRIQDYTTIEHSGGLYGFSSNILLVPALKLGLALFVNVSRDAGELNHTILKYLLPTFTRLLERQAGQSQAEQEPLPPVSLEWAQYIGRYREASLRAPFEVHLTPHRLIATIGDVEVTLLPRDKHFFQMQNGPFAGEDMRFVVDENNKVIHATSGRLVFVRV